MPELVQSLSLRVRGQDVRTHCSDASSNLDIFRDGVNVIGWLAAQRRRTDGYYPNITKDLIIGNGRVQHAGWTILQLNFRTLGNLNWIAPSVQTRVQFRCARSKRTALLAHGAQKVRSIRTGRARSSLSAYRYRAPSERNKNILRTHTIKL